MDNIELVMWNLGEGDSPSISRVRDCLESAGLSREHAADMALSTAFRRACDDIRKKEIVVKVFKKNDDLHCQVDVETVVGNGRLERSFIGSYRCHANKQIRIAENHSDSDIMYELQDKMDSHLATYQWGDVSKVVQDVIAKCGLGAYSPRRSGGVYFIPVNPARPALLSQIEAFCSRVGIRFLRYSVPDSDAQRQEVMDAVAYGMEQEIETHKQAIDEYNNPTTTVMDKRITSIEATQTLLVRLQGHLGNRYDALSQKLTDLKDRVNRLKSAPAAGLPISGGRRLQFN